MAKTTFSGPVKSQLMDLSRCWNWKRSVNITGETTLTVDAHAGRMLYQ